MVPMPRPADPSPYLDFPRDAWKERRETMPQVIDEADLKQLLGIGESMDLQEVADIYLPLSRLIHLQIRARQKLTAVTELFLGENPGHVPFILSLIHI